MEAEKTNDIGLLLERLGNGSLTGAEKEFLQHYVESTFQDEKLNELMQKHWNTMEQESYSNLDETDLKQVRKQILSRIKKPGLALRHPGSRGAAWPNFLVRVAAVLTIPLLLLSSYLIYQLNQHTEDRMVMQDVIATPGSRVHFVLPDQSEVWLNSGSSISYLTGLYINGQRRVKLNGEGYFQVVPDKKHPFIVETSFLNVKVLGTSFNVSNYAGDDFISSTLEKGLVALLDSKNDEVALLKPGQQAFFSKNTRELKIINVDTRLSTSWKDGKLVFRNSPLRDVTKQLERWFNCTIRVDPALMNSEISYTATIQNETLGEVLKMIEISTEVKTKIKNREVTICTE